MGKGLLDITFLVLEEAYIYHEFGETEVGGDWGLGIGDWVFVISRIQI